MTAAETSQEDKNPFELSVEEQLVRLLDADKAGGWKLTGREIDQLERTAPPWPKGRDAFRGISVRRGEGYKGQNETFETHLAQMERVFSPCFVRARYCLSGTHPEIIEEYADEDGRCLDHVRIRINEHRQYDRLRYYGRDDHMDFRPRVEWFLTDLADDASLDGRMLAHQGLSLAWLFPERVRAIASGTHPGWRCEGYRLNIPELDLLLKCSGNHDRETAWTWVPVVTAYQSSHGRIVAKIDVLPAHRDDSSIPSVRPKCQQI